VEQLLFAIIVAIVAVPALAARDPNPRRGVRRALLFLLAFTLVYVGYVTLVHATWVLPAG
jgi:xanthine/uracil permease